MKDKAIIAFIFITGSVTLTNLLMLGSVRSVINSVPGWADLLQRTVGWPNHTGKPSVDELLERVSELQSGDPPRDPINPINYPRIYTRVIMRIHGTFNEILK